MIEGSLLLCPSMAAFGGFFFRPAPVYLLVMPINRTTVWCIWGFLMYNALSAKAVVANHLTVRIAACMWY
jgi:hypothetical protein